jgi:hypothetical protein
VREGSSHARWLPSHDCKPSTVKTKEDARPVPERRVLPAALRCSRAGYGEFRIVFIGGRKIAEHFAGERNSIATVAGLFGAATRAARCAVVSRPKLALEDNNELAR